MIPKDTLDRLLEVGADFPVQTIGKVGDPFVITPNSMTVHDLSKFLPPTRIKRGVTLLEAGSFSDYVNRFKTDNTLIFANVTETGATFTALLDYHSPAPELKPAYVEHSAKYATVPTPEWTTWNNANRKQMSQVDFATWLEDNLPLFRSPTGGELLELVKTLEGKSDVRFNSAIRLQSGGNKLAYDEDVTLKGQVTTQAGFVELPKEIMAGIAPFQGAPPYEVRARLKFRIEGRKLAIWFETIAIHKIIRDSILLVVKEIAEKTGITPLIGNA